MKENSSKKQVKVPEMDLLPDPRKDRQMKEIVPPVHKPISKEYLYLASKIKNINKYNKKIQIKSLTGKRC